MKTKNTKSCDPRRCELCANYRQHYVMENKRGDITFIKTAIGHCSMPRLKNVYFYQTCESFEEKQPAEDGLVPPKPAML